MQDETLLNIVFVCGLALLILSLVSLINENIETSLIALIGGLVSIIYCFYRA